MASEKQSAGQGKSKEKPRKSKRKRDGIQRDTTGYLGNAACLRFKYIVIRGLGLHVAPALGNFDVSGLPSGEKPVESRLKAICRAREK